VFFWILGHFSEEISFLSSKLQSILPKLALKTVYYLVPNLQYFNLRDFWEVPNIVGPWMLVSLGYGLAYSAVFIGLSLWIFTRKEF
jgi:hypothetical protein